MTPPLSPRPAGTTADRPVFLNPLKVRLPVTAIVSLAHRISGLLLVLALPLGVYVLARSLAPGDGLGGFFAAMGTWPGRLVLLVMVWALAHHTAAGVRHLLFDAGIGTAYRRARRSAWAVHAVAGVAVLGVVAVLGLNAGAGA